MEYEKTSINNDTLLDALVMYSKLYHKPFSKEALLSGLPVNTEQGIFSLKNSKSLFSRVAGRAGLKSTLVQKKISSMLDLHLPVILLLSNENTCILEEFNSDRSQVKIVYPMGDEVREWVDVDALEKEYLGFAYLLKKEFKYSGENFKTLKIRSKHWFWDTLKLSSGIYRDVLLASLLVNIFVLATPLFTMSVYDRVIPNNAQETLMVFTIGIVFVYILNFFLKFTRGYMLEVAAKKSDIILSSIIFEKVLDLKMAVHPQSVGSFANNMKDFESIRSFLTTATMTAVIDLPFAIIFLFVIYYIGDSLVLIPLITMLLILSYALIIRKPLKQSIEKSHEASAKKNAILIETLQNIETVKTMSMNSKQQWLWEESTGEIAKKNFKSRILSSSLPNVTNFFIQLNTVFVVFFGVFLIQDFELTMGGLIAIVILTSRTVSPMGQAASLITNYSDAKSSYDVLNDIISREPEREEGLEFVSRPKFEGKIEFQNVSFTYPNSETPALTDVSFIINPKEKVAILGRIGSGKSTIAKLILKLYEPTSGTILIDGIDIQQIDPSDVRRTVSYVPQEINLFRGTLKENIVSSERHLAESEIIKAATLSTAEEFISRHPLGYEMPIGERGAGLSGGQRQSIGIARALMCDSSIMLMDEPSNSMDNTTELKLIDNLKGTIENSTVLLVTHKFSLLEMVDRIIVMDHSRVAIDNAKEVVIKKLGGKSDG